MRDSASAAGSVPVKGSEADQCSVKSRVLLILAFAAEKSNRNAHAAPGLLVHLLNTTEILPLKNELSASDFVS